MRYTVIFFLALLIAACQEKVKKDSDKEVESVPKTGTTVAYPAELIKVFDAHGGLESWKDMKNLVYEIPKSDFSELHTINLYSRKDRVETPDYAMGFDGREVWIDDPDNKYSGDPVFYHNLMFYFYAMPFVLADEGIIYSETEDLEFEGKSYPGIGIGYQQDVGTSPKDQYLIHYDPVNHQMAWLGYTVTYRTGEVSENVKWIRYEQWQETAGIVLPTSITWYDYEGRTLKEPKNTVLFENAALSKIPAGSDLFEKPDQARFVKPKIPNQ